MVSPIPLLILLAAAAAPLPPLPLPRMVKDIRPGPEGCEAAEFLGLGGFLYFRADDGVHGPELWRSDGTEAGTGLLADIEDGARGSRPEQLRALNGKLIFAASTAELGKELWIYDPATERARLVKDIRPGFGSQPASLAVIEDVLYFCADDGIRGAEPWRSDGTREGTRILADLRVGAGGVSPKSFVHYQGQEFLYIASGSRVFRSDGTTDGTRPVPGLLTSDSFFEGRDALYFIAPGGSKPALHRLERSSGKSHVFFEGSQHAVDVTAVLPDRLLVRTAETNRRSTIWSLPLPSGDPVQLASSPQHSEVLSHRKKDFLVLLALTLKEGETTCWASNGTAEGIHRLEGLRSTDWSIYWQDRWILSGSGPEGLGKELYETDGSPRGARLIQDMFEGTDGSNPEWLTPHEGTVFFTADDGKHGRELWVLPPPAGK